MMTEDSSEFERIKQKVTEILEPLELESHPFKVGQIVQRQNPIVRQFWPLLFFLNLLWKWLRNKTVAEEMNLLVMLRKYSVKHSCYAVGKFVQTTKTLNNGLCERAQHSGLGKTACFH